MNARTISVVVVIVTVLLLAQTVSIVDAHHKSKSDKDPRKVAEERTDDLKKVKQVKDLEKKKAFFAYKEAFDTWKTSKGEYRTAKITGDQTDIDAKKVILDVAKIAKDDAYDKYLISKRT